jgi:hypothetical protein
MRLCRILAALLALAWTFPAGSQAAPAAGTEGLGDLKAAEAVARSFVELSIAGRYADAVALLDPASLAAAQKGVLDLIDRARADGQEAQVAAMGIHASRAELQALSPADFFVKVIALMRPLPPGATVDVLSVARLADGRCAVKLALTLPAMAKPTEASANLKLIDGRWKVQLGF